MTLKMNGKVESQQARLSRRAFQQRDQQASAKALRQKALVELLGGESHRKQREMLLGHLWSFASFVSFPN